MAYCRKCGVQLKEDDAFCFMCGQPIDKLANAEAEEALANAELENESGSVSAPVPMSKEESIALAEKLRDEYSAIERLQKEVNENETTLKRPLVFSGRRYSAFRFFWPFFIYAYLALIIVYLIGGSIGAANDDPGGILFSLFLAFAAAIGLLIFGGVKARNKRDRLNEELGEEEARARRKQKELESHTAELKIKLNNRKRGISEYQNLIPIRFRTKHYMERAIVLLQTDRAANLSEALELLKTN